MICIGVTERKREMIERDKNAQIIVTGANGFIGRRLCHLLKNNFNVLGVSKEGCDLRLNLLEEDSWKKLDEYTNKPWVFLIHLAFISSGENMKDENHKMLENLCGFTDRQPNIFLLYPSTALVYGVKYREIITEDYPPNPESMYARVKLEIEKTLLRYFSSRCTIFRLTNVYGKPIKENTVIGKILNQIKKNVVISLSDYNSVRDFIYIDDVIESFRLMIRYIKVFENTKEDKKLKSPYTVFNISTGRPICIYDLAYTIASLYKKLELLPERENVIAYGLNEYLVPSPKKLEDLVDTGLAPYISTGVCSPLRPMGIEQGLERMIKNDT